jgi:DNA-directed RNA polymerase specialized sigma24 family protein
VDRSSPAAAAQTGSIRGAHAPGSTLSTGTSTPAPPEACADPDWRKLLSGTPREVLGRLVLDDPLRVREFVATRLRADALLLDADRVHLRAIARIARFSGHYRGRPVLRDWIESAVVEAVHELLREDHEPGRGHRTESARECRRADSEEPGVFASLARPLGLNPEAMRAACAAFNLLPLAERSAFFDFVLRGRSLDEMARTQGESATEVARRALDAVLKPALADEGKGGGA